MFSDIKLNNTIVVLKGTVAIGINNPVRPLHVEVKKIILADMWLAFLLQSQ